LLRLSYVHYLVASAFPQWNGQNLNYSTVHLLKVNASNHDCTHGGHILPQLSNIAVYITKLPAPFYSVAAKIRTTVLFTCSKSILLIMTGGYIFAATLQHCCVNNLVSSAHPQWSGQNLNYSNGDILCLPAQSQCFWSWLHPWRTRL
jgi:hypothetical protein